MSDSPLKTTNADTTKKFFDRAASIEQNQSEVIKFNKKIERQEKRQEVIRKKYENYIKQVHQNFTIHQIPDSFKNCRFSAFGKSLYHVPQGLVFEIKNFPQFQEMFFPDYKDSDDETAITNQKKLYRALYGYCSYLTNSSDYPTLIHTYKLLLSNPNALCFLDHPLAYFFLNDSNICFNPNGHDLTQIEHARCSIVSSKRFIQYFNENKIPVPPKNMRDRIFKEICRLVKDSYKNWQPELKPYTLLYKMPTPITIQYDPIGKRFSKVNGATFDINISKAIPIQQSSFSEEYYPKVFLDFLYMIGSGSLENIDKFAQTIAGCYLSVNKNPKLTIIVGNRSSLSLIWDFLKVALDHNYLLHSIKELCNHREIMGLAEYCLKGTYANISYLRNHASLPDRENHEVLSKIINSKPLKIREKLQDEITFINSLQLICLTEDELLASQLSNSFPATVIKLMPPNDQNNETDDAINCIKASNIDELSWIRTIFTFHGLTCLASKNSSPKEKKYQDSIENFISSCCIEDTSSEYYAVDLYKKYSIFASKYYGYTPYTQIRFNKELKKIGKYKFERPHHSRSTANRSAFIGISVDEDRFESIINTYDEKVRDEKIKDNIKDYLICMNHDYIQRTLQE